MAVNGRIAGTVASYTLGDACRASGVMAPYFEEGANEVVAYEVTGEAGGVTLHPVAEGEERAASTAAVA